MTPLEARYHRLHLHNSDIAGHPIRTVAGPVLCGCGSCGDELAEVVLIPFDLSWGIEIRRGYSQDRTGVWRWNRHDDRRRPVRWGGQLITARGDLITRLPGRTTVERGVGEHVVLMKRIGALRPGEALSIGCRQASPHISRISYDRLMKGAIIDERLMPT
jgi:hypothetical protein